MTAQESPQTDLFEGISDLKAPQTLGGREVASQYPVAQVVLESDVPHLDRLFDYLVPADLDELAQPGTRVRVKFGGQRMSGYLRHRVETSGYAGNLKFLEQVVSPIPVVPPETFELADLLAARCASVLSNVLRLAVVPRIASVEKPYLAADYEPQPPARLEPVDLNVFELYEGSMDFAQALTAGQAPRAVMTVLPGSARSSWEDILARSLVAAAATGRSAIAVVPDYKDLARLEKALDRLVGAEAYATLTGHQKPADRYRSYLRALYGEVRIVVGTRSAAYAPVENLGLVVCWDDGDSNLVEQRSPYCHVRDVLLLRASQMGAAALFAGFAMSSEAARLVKTRWATYLGAPRQLLREHTPHVLSTGDDLQLARDPLAAVARIPHLAFSEARKALARGPVLVQVSRAGYVPTFACSRCRMPARCTTCRGPLRQQGANGVISCGWCGRLVHDWHCTECGFDRWRTTSAGALRTAEELGRAFPNVPVVSSSGEHILTDVGAEPALVVATPGAEPVAEGGYAAALLLDADSMIQRDSLRAPETALRKWLNAAALVRPRTAGGTVVITAGQSMALEALIRWDPTRFALWELEERAELSLPPAVRTASITGTEQAVLAFLELAQLPESVTVRGPIEVESFGEQAEQELSRALLFFSYAAAAEVTSQLRATRASSAALRLESVNIRCDGLDIL